MTCDCPSTMCPSVVRACRVIGVGETGRTWPRTARIRFISRMPSSKSPPSTAVIAAISRFPSACPASPFAAPSVSGNRYCRTSLMSGSASARATMQLRMSPTGGMPSSVAQHARRPTIVGDGHDRGQVAGVLLEPAQQRRQAGPAADRHDPRPAGEEPLLVDELDQRLVRIGRAERVGQGVHRLVRAEHDKTDPDRRGREAAQLERQELERERIDQRAGDAGRLEIAGDLAEEVGQSHGEQDKTGEADQQPALDPDAGGQPAPQVHVRSSSRWKTVTGPKSCSRSHAATSSATTIERWKPPVQPMAMVSRVLPSPM